MIDPIIRAAVERQNARKRAIADSVGVPLEGQLVDDELARRLVIGHDVDYMELRRWASIVVREAMTCSGAMVLLLASIPDDVGRELVQRLHGLAVDAFLTGSHAGDVRAAKARAEAPA